MFGRSARAPSRRLWHVLDDALGLELTQSFADRGSAHRKLLGERLLSQAAAGRVLAREDLRGDAVGQAADELFVAEVRVMAMRAGPVKSVDIVRRD